MKKLLRYLVMSLFILGLTNCSSSLYMLNPDEPSTLEMGRNVIEKETDDAYSTISFEEQVEEEFIFHVFTYNKDQDDFVFDPSFIYVKNYDINKKPLGDKIYAVDPEKQIELLNDDIEERDDENDVVTGLNIAFALFDSIIDLADDEDNDGEEVLENVVLFTGNQINEEVSYKNDIDYLKAEKSYWKNDVLRRTELTEDDGVDGIIYIPLNPDAKYLKMFIPIGEAVHIYKFEQIAN
jgi:hypothetical protein